MVDFFLGDVPVGCALFFCFECCGFVSSIVGLVVEFFEEEEEHYRVHANPPNEGFRVVAVDKEELECVNHDAYELDLKQENEMY